MNYYTATGTTETATAFTLKDLEKTLKVLRSQGKPEYMLVCPDGRMLQGSDPWALAAATGELPEILKYDPMSEIRKQGGESNA